MSLVKYTNEKIVNESPVLPEVPVENVNVIENNQDINQDLDMLGEATTSVEGLLKIHNVLNANKENGVSPNTARIAMISTEHLCQRLGITMKDDFVSLEHFDSIHSKSQATQISMEAIGEKISKIFSAFVAMMKNLISKIFEFFNNIFNAAEQKRVEQYQHAIKSEVDRLKKSDNKKDIVITNQSVISAFYDTEKGITDEVVIKVTDNLTKYVDFLLEATAPCEDYFNEVLATLRKFEQDLHNNVYDAKYNGERVDSHLIGYVTDKVNNEFSKLAAHYFKDVEKFDFNSINDPDIDKQGFMHVTGTLCNRERYVIYNNKYQYQLTCDKVRSSFNFNSSEDTVYKNPSLDVANRINNSGVIICEKMVKLSSIVSQKHSVFKKQINRLLNNIDSLVSTASNHIDDDTYRNLYVNSQLVMGFMQKFFVFYKSVLASGLKTTKENLDYINMMSKAIVSGYQRTASDNQK